MCSSNVLIKRTCSHQIGIKALHQNNTILMILVDFCSGPFIPGWSSRAFSIENEFHFQDDR